MIKIFYPRQLDLGEWKTQFDEVMKKDMRIMLNVLCGAKMLSQDPQKVWYAEDNRQMIGAVCSTVRNCMLEHVWNSIIFIFKMLLLVKDIIIFWFDRTEMNP